MKKLYFLLPVIAWIGLYFLWGYSYPIIQEVKGMKAGWWALTDMAGIFVVGFLCVYAVKKNIR